MIVLRIVYFTVCLAVVFAEINLESYEDLLKKPVFSSSQLVELPLSRICSNTKELNNIIPLNNKQYMFYSISDSCGLILFKLTDKGYFEQLKLYPQITNVVFAKFNKERQALWIVDSNMLVTVYSTQNPSMLFLINQFSTNNPTYQINFSRDNKQSFLIQGGDQILIYNIDKTEFSLLQSLSNIKNPQQVIVSTKNKVMIVAAYNIHFYQIQNQYDPSAPYQLSKTYILINEDDTQFIEIIEDKYLYSWGLRTGLSQYSIQECVETSICNQNNIILMYSQQNLGYNFAFVTLTSDKNYFVTFLNSYGIYIFDVQQKQKFTLFQTINLKGIINSMFLSDDESFLLIVQNGYLNVFQRIQSNLNIDTPNILNNMSQNYLFPLQQNMQTNLSWHCYLENNILITTQNQNGAYFLEINSINQHLKVINKIDLQFQEGIEEVRLLNDRQYFIASYGDKGLYFYKQSNNFSVLEQISVFTSPIPNSDMDCIKQSANGKTLFVASGYAGIIVIDITNILQPKFITSVSYKFTKKQINASAENVFIGKDEKYLYCSYRYLGFVIYDISDINNPYQVNLIYTKGGEDVLLTADWKHLISMDGLYGINIYSLENDPTNPQWISSVQTDGLSLHMKLLKQDQFILTTSLQRGQLFLIDFRNRNMPSILQTFQQQDLNNYSFDVCLTSDEQISFIITPQGIVQIPLNNNILFHTDIIWLQQKSENFSQQKVLMNPATSTSKVILQVGMTVLIQLSQIYPNNQIILLDCQYNDHQIVKGLPSWISLSESELSATLQISKEALNQKEIQDLLNTISDKSVSQHAVISKQKQLIFKFSERVNGKDFVMGSLGITNELSYQIFTDCKKKKIISQSGFINENIALTYLNDMYQNDLVYTDEVLEQIKYVLRNKIIYYPVGFYIQNSLFIDIYSHGQVINSFSERVQVQFSINLKQAKFVEQKYPSLTISLNEQQDHIQLEGELSQINKILTIGVKIATLTEISAIQITMEVNDFINYSLTKKFYANQSKIISLNQSPYINPNFSLQNDFDKKYIQGSIAILEQFTYRINNLLFLDDDTLNMNFITYIKDENGYFYQLPSGYWLEFDSNSRQLSGTPPYTFWYKNIELKIVASDGYYQVQDYLTIHIDRIPISVLIILLLQILGPIIGLILIWKCSSKIYNLCQKKNHETTLMKVRAGRLIEIQIPLIKHEIQIAKKLWLKYFNQIYKDEFILTINYFKQKFVEKRLYEKYMKYYQQSQPIQTANSEQILLDTQQRGTIHSQQNITSTMYKQSGYTLFQNSMNKYSKNISTNFFSVTLNQETSKYEESSHLKINAERSPMSKRMKESMQQNKLLKQITMNENQQKKKSRNLTRKLQQSNSKLENSFLQPNGHINGKYIINQVLDHYLLQNRAKINEDIAESLSNIDSKISRCVIGLAAISIAKLDGTTNKIIEFLKEKSMYYYTPQDWYKRYVNITPCFDKVQTDAFPIIEVNDDTLLSDLSIFTYDQNDDMLKESNGPSIENTHVPYFLPLIKDMLVAIAYGFTFDSYVFIPRPVGECLQISAQNIKCIESYTLSTSKSCLCLKKILDKEYVKKELIENSKLNSWITSVDIINNVILLSGTPQNKDCGKYLLKIKDRLGYTIKRINIDIQYNRDLSSKYVSNQLDLQRSVHPNIDAVAIEFGEDNPKQTPIQNNTHSNSQNQFSKISYAKDDSLVF